MRHEGDVVAGRRFYFEAGGHNLSFLLEQRFAWMNEYIAAGAEGVEVGAGIGVSKLFIRAKSFVLSDFRDAEWLDVKHVDALSTPFPDDRFDFVVSSNMIHHVPYPMRFFEEMHRILKPGGVLLIQEINASLLMRAVLRLMRHEGYSYAADVFGDEVCTDPNDLWSANCAIPNLLFDDLAGFESHVPFFTVRRSTFSELLLFLNSGGVVAKTFSVPLPRFALRMLKGIDDRVASALPGIFALQRQIVLEKTARRS